jgi:hypothetical protein
MKKMLKNLHYFNISKENPEKALDEFYIFPNKHPDIKKYTDNTKEIKSILITIKTLKDKKENKKIINKYILELSKALGDFSNCSEFGCFINACDSSLDLAKNDINLLEKITFLYIDNRVLNEVVPEEWIQAILDSNSSRKKGKCGELKLLNILSEIGFKEIKKWEEFDKESKCVARCSKNFSTKNIRKTLGIKLKTKKQDKNLDLVIKYEDKIFICEAKHLNNTGGEQDKQISELIEIISLVERREDVSYISFLDGSHSNTLLDSKIRKGKIATQRNEINKYLNSNSNNFWVNTAGFKAMFSK